MLHAYLRYNNRVFVTDVTGVLRQTCLELPIQPRLCWQSLHYLHYLDIIYTTKRHHHAFRVLSFLLLILLLFVPRKPLGCRR